MNGNPEPPQFHVVFMDLNLGTIWFEAIMSGAQLQEYKKLLWSQTLPISEAEWKADNS